MTQYDFGAINATLVSGSQLATMLGSDRDAMQSMHKGATPPAYAKAGMGWMDDALDPIWKLKIYNGTTWGTLYVIDTTDNSISIPADAATLNGLTASQFLRGDQDANMLFNLEARYGLHAGYGSGGSSGSGTNWAAPVWSIGRDFNGVGFGSSWLPNTDMYGLTWCRSTHSTARSDVGEGLYLYRTGVLLAALGHSGNVFTQNILLEYVNPIMDLKDTDGTRGGLMHGRWRLLDQNGNQQFSMGVASSVGNGHVANSDGNLYLQASRSANEGVLYLQVADNGGSFVTVGEFRTDGTKIDGSLVALLENTGTTNATDLARGHTIAVHTNGTHYARNQLIVPRISDADGGHYDIAGSGAALSGSWRCSGQCSDANNQVVNARRVA